LKNILFFLLITVFSTSLISQHKVGVRAGVNYGKFSGPLEENESYGISSGFHFGINYTYLLNDRLSFRGEIVYSQRGNKQSYVDTLGGSYYIINPNESSINFTAIGNIEYNLEVTNSYLSIPLTANYRLGKKLEAFGGFSLEFLIGPSAKGLVDFSTDEFFFTQSLDHRYGSDAAGGFNRFNQEIVEILFDGERLTMPRFIGAYYNFTPEQKTGQRFKRFDSNLIVGLNYFINPGFYIGGRIEYGLFDITNDEMDFSLRELDAEQNFIFRDDKDRSINLGLSFGFRF